MNVTPLFLLVCHLLSAKVRGESSIRGTQKEEQHTVGKLQEQSVVCMVEQVDVKFSNYEPSPSNDAASTANDSDSAFLCVTDQDNAADQSFVIDLPPLVLENITHHEHPVLSISDAVLDNEAVQLSVIKDASIDIDDSPSQHRSLASATGTGQVLVLRITYRGISPSLSADQLASRVFGLGNNPERHSLSSQIDACSFRQLQLRPAEGDDIVNGIAEISIDKRVAGSNSVLALDNLVVANATRRFGRLSTQFAHVLFVFPSAGLLFGGRGWLAYAYFNGWRSVYNDKWGGSLSALMHEVGHNLNLNHAGRGSQNYGDVTGYMGWGTSKIGAPTSCFNAQKSWALGWYKDRSLSLSLPDFPWGGQVAFFGEYDKTTPDQPVILSLEDGSKRFFLQYNRAKGMNEQTREFPNQVVLVSDEGPGDGRWGPQSRLEGAIGLNEQSTRRNFRIQNFEASGFPLFIRVCDEVEGPPDLVRLSIHLEDGTQSDTCNLNIEASAQTTPCDDDFSAVFFVDPNRGYKDCGWLARVMAKSDFWSEALCQEGHEAYNSCAETCGKCTDKCEDTTGAFFYVNARHGNKDCEWLSTRTPWREKLCHEGNAAYAYCQESCNVCD